ncbi:UvrD-helicase domain-containing protein [Streptomyces sp. 8N114]|uniref:UvrD-helicase domain-containing protein n=1 Tax=Streptomyces sp. 8N114 TaxID=3457419 RepID=UPI003FD3EC0D
MPEPTEEQAAVIDAFASGDDLVVQAGAGTGKTTTLEMLGASDDRRGLYISFNKSVAVEARRRFPQRVKCSTAHALAFRAVAIPYKHRLGAPRLPSHRIAASLGIQHALPLAGKVLEPRNLAYITLQTVQSFCWSAERELSPRHVPFQRGAEEPETHQLLVQAVMPFAREAWQDATDPEGHKVNFKHDHYLKMWQLQDPQLPYDYVLLDEAQDTNGVLDDVIKNQRGRTQIVLVGDSAQQIYAWRGARDVMTRAPGTHLHLSQSFRFGDALAQEANRWLGAVRSGLRLTGHAPITTRIGRLEQPDAVLCRTNAGALTEVLSHLGASRRVAMAGGGDELRKLALAARDLKAGRGTSHPELLLFKTWGEVQEYAENDPSGADLLPWVELIDDLGYEEILGSLQRLGDEDSSDVTISTAHKAKGREWPRVRIGDDFPEPDPEENGKPGRIPRAEARLAYVAVTRAQHHLDRGSLSWILDHPAGQPTVRTDAAPRQPAPAAGYRTWGDLGPTPKKGR